MPLQNPAITAAQLLMTVNQSNIAPLVDSLPIKLPINFAGVANLQVISGTYTPANDAKTLATFNSGNAPNFIVLICDGQLNLNTQHLLVNGLQNLPVQKVLFWAGTPAPDNYINAIFITGQTNQHPEMAQGVAVNYTLIVGQATLT